MTAVINVTATDPGFSFDRGPDGNVVFTVLTLDLKLNIDVGRSLSNVQGIIEDVACTAGAAMAEIVQDWENTPEDRDGYVVLDKGMYFVQLDDGKYRGDPKGYPTQDIATYELARLMAEDDFMPNAWYQGQVGYNQDINDAVKAFLGDDAKLKPLDGVVYDDDATVMLEGDDYPYTVVHDYGTMGVVLHFEGDPSEQRYCDDHTKITPYVRAYGSWCDKEADE